VDWFWHAIWIGLVLIPVTILWIATVIDIIWRYPGSTSGRLVWLLIVLLIPVIGALVYIFRRPPITSDHADDHGSDSWTRDLDRVSELHRNGSLTDSEVSGAKAHLLGGSAGTSRVY
jgi:hypothetical protein